MKQLEHCGCFPTGEHYPGIAHLVKVIAAGLSEDFDPETPLSELPIACIDTETTGTNARADRVIEIGVVMGRAGEPTTRHNWLINPGMPIPAESTNIHGIKDEDVADKPAFSEVAEELIEVLRGTVAAAYNASFDKGFLLEELARAGMASEGLPPALQKSVTWIDPLIFARELYKGRGESRALGAVAERLGISLERAHRATDDAEAALRVFYAMAEDSRIPDNYASLVQEQRRLQRQQQEAQRFWRK